MCGLAGYSGVAVGARSLLVYGLGVGVDTRGGHAAGYVGIGDHGGQPRVARRIGRWEDSKLRFLAGAAGASTLLMHARYATCGARDTLANAHPFTIMRDGRPSLYGAHNGVLSDADDSAREHDRRYTVDSKELFELLADAEEDRIGQIHGYGVITWVEADSPRVVRLAKISECGDIEVAQIVGGGLVWGSTRAIVYSGLDLADLDVEAWYAIKTGVQYEICDGRIWQVPERPRIVLADRWGSDYDDDWLQDYRMPTVWTKTDVPTGLHEAPRSQEDLDWEMFALKWEDAE